MTTASHRSQGDATLGFPSVAASLGFLKLVAACFNLAASLQATSTSNMPTANDGHQTMVSTPDTPPRPLLRLLCRCCLMSTLNGRRCHRRSECQTCCCMQAPTNQLHQAAHVTYLLPCYLLRVREACIKTDTTPGQTRDKCTYAPTSRNQHLHIPTSQRLVCPVSTTT